ncbi:MAG TPA: PAS domain S-box protein [Ramlibacter sp.]|nr:PAS domain S-box protein [Ramlibacter sp.]
MQTFLPSHPTDIPTQALPQTRGGQEKRFQLLVEAVVDYGIFLLDPQGHIASWNSGAQKLKGYTREEVLGRHFSLFYPAESVAAGWPQEELRRAVAQGRLEDEGWRVRKDGSHFWANVVITPLYEGGELTGFAKITRDLTERRQHEEELRSSEERFRLLVSTVRDYSIFMLGPDGTIRSWNAGAQAIKGYAAGEVIGRHFSLFYPPQDRQAGKPEHELAAALADGRVEDEGWRVRKDGSLFWANVVITAVRDAHGDLLGFAKVTRDMTERRKLDDLERSSRRMNEFLAMLGHELRNPLAPIRNAVSIMQLETLTTPALRNCRDIIDRQLTHVTRLVDDLLDVGRLNTGKISLRRELVRLDDVVARSVEAVRPLAQARRHQLSVQMPAVPLYLNCDPTRLAQILQNLLVNAAKYTPDGGHIEVGAQLQDRLVSISVRDNGRGLTPDELERVFGLFMQGESSAVPNESGLGIGLTLARTLAEMHGGTVEGFSLGRGQGSVFTCRLPAADPPAAEAGEAPRPAARRVLVVDDNRDAADTCANVLRLLGYAVDCAYDGRSAAALALEMRPHVVLLDLAMPGMNGYDTLKQLRGHPATQHAFVIALTGYGSEEDKARARAAGFDAHLIKPVELPAMVALLEDAQARQEATSG